MHCKHIIFGGSGDNGYARLLSQYSGDEAVKHRITMLEGPPFSFELQKLTNKFTTTAFPKVFRDTKLPGRPVAVGQATILPKPEPSPPKTSYASVSKSVTNGDSPIVPTMQKLPVQSPPQNHLVVLVNSNGNRYDTLLPRTTPEVLNKLQSRQESSGRKICNRHHLLGYCEHGDNCIFNHDPLNAVELDAQRYRARKQVCDSIKGGYLCEDPLCWCGHECPDRRMCRRNDCKFGDYHNITRD